jgi:dTMP kinase
MSFPDYKTRIGAEIRAYLHGERDYPPQVAHMLFAANRWEKKPELERLLAKNDFVLVNRYSESNLAFGAAIGLDPKWLAGLENGLPKPAMVVVLDAHPSALYDRRRAKDEYERSIRIQRGARKAYLRLASKMGWEVVDASAGIEGTSAAIGRAMDKFLRHRTP